MIIQSDVFTKKRTRLTILQIEKQKYMEELLTPQNNILKNIAESSKNSLTKN